MKQALEYSWPGDGRFIIKQIYNISFPGKNKVFAHIWSPGRIKEKTVVLLIQDLNWSELDQQQQAHLWYAKLSSKK